MLLTKDIEIWWYWDDIANALEISAEVLLSELSEEQTAKHVRVQNIASMIGADRFSMLENMGFGQNEFEHVRFMSNWCLEHFLEFYGEHPIVAQFREWIGPAMEDAQRKISHLDSYCRSALQCADLALIMKHLAFALNGDTLGTHLALSMAESGIVCSALNFFDFSYKKDRMLHKDA
jgi:hypothetical protein